MFTRAVSLYLIQAFTLKARRKASRISFALILACCMSGAHAQRIDFGRMLSDAIGSALTGCGKYRDWLAAAPIASATRNPAAHTPLVEDAVFVPVFGKPYREFTHGDLAQAQRTIAECRKVNAITPADQMRANQIFHPSQHQAVLRQWQALQAQRDEFAAVQRELANVPISAEGLSSIDRLSARGEAALRDNRVEGDLQAFRQDVALARQRVGVPVFTQRVADTVAKSRGTHGVRELVELRETLARASLGVPVTLQLHEQIDAQVAAIAPTAIAEEAALLPAPRANDLASLAIHTTALRGFDGRTRSLINVVPAYRELRVSFLDARTALLPEAFRQVSLEVGNSRSAEQPSSILRQYFLEEELATGGGATLRALAAERTNLLRRISADVAMFGPQPEHELLLGGQRAQPTKVTSQAEVTRCDLMAAHPDDPARVASGVPDERFDRKAALAALATCAEAVKRNPNVGRLFFQLARAQLHSDLEAEAIATLKRAVDLQHGGAHYYLSEAFRVGVKGLPANERLAKELAARALALGFGTGASRAEPDFTNPMYEDAALIRAVYYGISESLKADTYTFHYLLAQAQLLAGDDCRNIRLSEVQDFVTRFQLARLPSTQGELFQKGFEALFKSFETLSRIAKDPRSIAQDAAAGRRVENAGEYGARDIYILGEATGGCKGAALTRYARNLRVYMQTR